MRFEMHSNRFLFGLLYIRLRLGAFVTNAIALATGNRLSWFFGYSIK